MHMTLAIIYYKANPSITAFSLKQEVSEGWRMMKLATPKRLPLNANTRSMNETIHAICTYDSLHDIQAARTRSTCVTKKTRRDRPSNFRQTVTRSVPRGLTITQSWASAFIYNSSVGCVFWLDMLLALLLLHSLRTRQSCYRMWSSYVAIDAAVTVLTLTLLWEASKIIINVVCVWCRWRVDLLLCDVRWLLRWVQHQSMLLFVYLYLHPTIPYHRWVASWRGWCWSRWSLFNSTCNKPIRHSNQSALWYVLYYFAFLWIVLYRIATAWITHLFRIISQRTRDNSGSLIN